jgi:hypothetical protein
MMTDDEDKATRQMFALVGQAITEWTFVEERLSNVFMVCFSSVPAYPDSGLSFGNSAVQTAIFFSVENFRGKLGLVDAALMARVYGQEPWEIETRAEWLKLHRKVQRLSRKRNRLAHWTVLPAHEYEKLHAARLLPPIGSPAYYREMGIRPKGDVLSPLHVSHMIKSFRMLSERLYEFAHCLARQEGLTVRYAEQMARLIDTHERMDPKRAALIRHAITQRQE